LLKKGVPYLRTIFSLVLLLFLALNLYIGWHGVLMLSTFSLSISPVLYWTLFWLLAFSYPLGRLIPGPVGRFLKVIGSYYLAIFELSLLLFLLNDILTVIFRFCDVPQTTYQPALSVTILLTLLLLLFWGSWNAWRPIKRTYHITIDKESPSKQSLRIAMVSDLHLGNIVGNHHLRKLVQRVNDMQPDLILLVGDVLDDVIEPFLRNRMADTLQQLRAPLGVYAVLGNHEYIGRNIDQYVAAMKEIGIPVLRDETVLLQNGLYLVGRKDKMAERVDPQGRMSVKELLSSLDRQRPIIVMDHQPAQLNQALQAGADLLLSGHTHRGQIAPNHLITRRLFELDWGYLHKEQMHVVVSSGFGTWGPPIRLGSRCEYIELMVHFRKEG
jgi:predicted MPP superfamily phosphohydrolase